MPIRHLNTNVSVTSCNKRATPTLVSCFPTLRRLRKRKALTCISSQFSQAEATHKAITTENQQSATLKHKPKELKMTLKGGHFNTTAFTAFCTGWGPHTSHCVAGKPWCRSLLHLKSTAGLPGVSWPRPMPRDTEFASPFAFFPTRCKLSRCRPVQRPSFQGNWQIK